MSDYRVSANELEYDKWYTIVQPPSPHTYDEYIYRGFRNGAYRFVKDSPHVLVLENDPDEIHDGSDDLLLISPYHVNQYEFWYDVELNDEIYRIPSYNHAESNENMNAASSRESNHTDRYPYGFAAESVSSQANTSFNSHIPQASQSFRLSSASQQAQAPSPSYPLFSYDSSFPFSQASKGSGKSRRRFVQRHKKSAKKHRKHRKSVKKGRRTTSGR